jgi:hypothetical protein
MALTFTKRVRNKMGNKAFRLYEITPDGSVTTINASDIDLKYIEYATLALKDVMTAVAAHAFFTGNAYGTYVVTGATHTASEVLIMQAWGW